MEHNTALSTELQVLTHLGALVSAVFLTVNGQVAQLTGQVGSLQELLVTYATTPGMHSD